MNLQVGLVVGIIEFSEALRVVAVFAHLASATIISIPSAPSSGLKVVLHGAHRIIRVQNAPGISHKIIVEVGTEILDIVIFPLLEAIELLYSAGAVDTASGEDFGHSFELGCSALINSGLLDLVLHHTAATHSPSLAIRRHRSGLNGLCGGRGWKSNRNLDGLAPTAKEAAKEALGRADSGLQSKILHLGRDELHVLGSNGHFTKGLEADWERGTLERDFHHDGLEGGPSTSNFYCI
jgi:hypothetical protein